MAPRRRRSPPRACARRTCMACPLLVFRVRMLIIDASLIRAISPPSASISRTSWLFPGPPIAGLHGILPISLRLIVTSAVWVPRRLAASDRAGYSLF